jgi:hypothetical protein
VLPLRIVPWRKLTYVCNLYGNQLLLSVSNIVYIILLVHISFECFSLWDAIG